MRGNPMLSCLAAVGLIAGGVSCAPGPRPGLDAFQTAAQQYDVRILRDTWGVPHIFGKTDADAAFGLAYAHAEDDFVTIQETLLSARGRLATLHGRPGAEVDYVVGLLRIWDYVRAQYGTDLRPGTRALVEAYAAGLNYYAARHPDEVLQRGLFPATGQDLVAGFMLRVPFFFFLQRDLRELHGPERPRGQSPKPLESVGDFYTRGADLGSNGLAVAPRRTPDGKTHLAINSHNPWTGPVAWYEAHMHSDEGMDVVGGTFPGAPVILNGHNRALGWVHTVNLPDLVDVYTLEMNPENPNQYRFDGAWRDLDVRIVRIRVQLFPHLYWTFRRETLWSAYGPAIRRPHGVYALRYAGLGEVRQVEQWYRMGKARDFDEWLAAMRMRAIPSLNAVYADREGNIYYVYNALLPERARGYDWRACLPGDTSETLWTRYLPYDALPQVWNPASGFLVSCNQTPFRVTADPGNPDPEAYPPELGIESAITNRALRALELLGGDESITEEEFHAYKYDMTYSRASRCAALLAEVLNAPPPDDPVVREALDVLRAWDLSADPGNRSMAMAALAFEPLIRAEMLGDKPPDLWQTLKERAHVLKDTHGRLDVPWSEVNRLRRGAADLGLGGGPDTLRAVYGKLRNGRIIANEGDCYILMVTWDPDGRVRSQSIHQFGSATLDAASPHYADQAPLFAGCKLKPVWLDEADIRAHLEREYRPGETPAGSP